MKSIFQIIACGLLASNFFDSCSSYESCKKVIPAQNWDKDVYFNNLNAKGHYVHATSECQNCEGEDRAWDWLRERTNPTKFCFRLSGAARDVGQFGIDAYCEWPNIDVPFFHCALDFSKYQTTIRMKGTSTIILTDNQNYYVTNFCIFGMENVWYITSPKPTIDKSLKQEVIEKIADMGLSTKEAVKGKSAVTFTNVTGVVKC